VSEEKEAVSNRKNPVRVWDTLKGGKKCKNSPKGLSKRPEDSEEEKK